MLVDYHNNTKRLRYCFSEFHTECSCTLLIIFWCVPRSLVYNKIFRWYQIHEIPNPLNGLANFYWCIVLKKYGAVRWDGSSNIWVKSRPCMYIVFNWSIWSNRRLSVSSHNVKLCGAKATHLRTRKCSQVFSNNFLESRRDFLCDFAKKVILAPLYVDAQNVV